MNLTNSFSMGAPDRRTREAFEDDDLERERIMQMLGIPDIPQPMEYRSNNSFRDTLRDVGIGLMANSGVPLAEGVAAGLSRGEDRRAAQAAYQTERADKQFDQRLSLAELQRMIEKDKADRNKKKTGFREYYENNQKKLGLFDEETGELIKPVGGPAPAGREGIPSGWERTPEGGIRPMRGYEDKAAGSDDTLKQYDAMIGRKIMNGENLSDNEQAYVDYRTRMDPLKALRRDILQGRTPSSQGGNDLPDGLPQGTVEIQPAPTGKRRFKTPDGRILEEE